MTNHIHDQPLSAYSGESLLSLRDLIAKVRISRSQIYKLIGEGKLPAPIKVSEKSSRWILSEIDQWLEERKAASRAQGGVK